MDGIWELTDALTPKDKKTSRLVSATVTKVDDEGTVWVHLPSGQDETPINGLSTSEVKPGDQVQVEIENGRANLIGNASAPSVGQEKVDETIAPVKSSAEKAERTASEASSTADAARAIAEATGQHFWYDTNGAHISTEALNPEGAQNSLWNSLGMLFRRGANNLLALVTGSSPGVAIYDGNGNADANIVAKFTASAIELARNSWDSIISLCGGGATMKVTKRADESSYFSLAASEIEVVSADDAGALVHLESGRTRITADGGASGDYYDFMDSTGAGILLEKEGYPSGIPEMTLKAGNIAIGNGNNPVSGDLRIGDIGIGTTYEVYVNGGPVTLDNASFPGGAPSTDYFRDILRFTTPAFTGGRIGYLNTFYLSDGSRGVGLYATRDVNGTTVNNALRLGVTPGGYRYVWVHEKKPWLEALGTLQIATGTRGQDTNVGANSYKDFNITFGRTFASAPTVVVGLASTSTASSFGRINVAVKADSVTTTGCTIRIFNDDSTPRSPGFRWAAFGY